MFSLDSGYVQVRFRAYSGGYTSAIFRSGLGCIQVRFGLYSGTMSSRIPMWDRTTCSVHTSRRRRMLLTTRAMETNIPAGMSTHMFTPHVSAHVYAHVFTHVRTNVYTHVSTHAYPTCLHIRLDTCLHTCLYTCLHVSNLTRMSCAMFVIISFVTW